MSAVWLSMRAQFRNRWRAWLGLALFLGFFGGAIIAAAAGARRTNTAYPRFLRAFAHAAARHRLRSSRAGRRP